MNRRDFMGLVLMYPALEIISDIAFAQSRTKKSYTNQLINNLVRELSEYDIVHFGEFHPTKNLKGPSTLEDFVDFLLPKFRDPNIVQRPYDSIRAENMVVEVFPIRRNFTGYNGASGSKRYCPLGQRRGVFGL